MSKWHKDNRERLNEARRERTRRKKLGLPLLGRVTKGVDIERKKKREHTYYLEHGGADRKRRNLVDQAAAHPDPQSWLCDHNNEKRQRKNAYNRKYKQKQDSLHRGTGSSQCMAKLLRARTRTVLLHGHKKAALSRELLGCSYETWVDHLGPDYKFMKAKKLQIDHIWPIAAYDLSDPAEQLRAFNYKNTRLCSARDNRSKGCRVPSRDLQNMVPIELWPHKWLDQEYDMD